MSDLMKTRMITVNTSDEMRVAPIRPWHRHAPCQTAKVPYTLWFPEEWQHEADPTVKRICQMCPYAVQCLNDAIDFDETDGVRGGTTMWIRDRIRDEKNRMRCPGCNGDNVVPMGAGEMCMGCGISWFV